MISYREHLKRAEAAGYELRTAVTRKTVRYAPKRANDRWPFVTEDGEHYPAEHVAAFDRETGKRYNR